jgi:hypothetical protein
MLARIGDIVVDFWQSLTGRERVFAIVLNVAFLALFFIGVPRGGILDYALMFVLLEGVYLALLYIVKTRILGD